MGVHHGADAPDTGDRVEQHAGPVGRGDDGAHTRPRGDAGGGHLRRHAAAAPQRARPAHLLLERWSMPITSSINDAFASRRGSAVSTPGVSVSMTSRSAPTRCATSAARRSLSPKRISSSAIASFSFTIGHGAELEEARERLSGVEVLTALDEVVRHEQHLCGNQAVSGENVVVRAHEPALAGRGEGLERRQIDGSLGEPQGGDPGRHRARRDDDHVVPVDAELRDLVTELLDRPTSIAPARSVIDDVPIFDDDPLIGALNGQARSRS